MVAFPTVGDVNNWGPLLQAYIDEAAANGGANAVGKDTIEINAADHGLNAAAPDNTDALQSLLTSLQPGADVKIPAGNYSFAGPLTIATSDVKLRLARGANLIHTVNGQDAIVITGQRVSIEGPGRITSPANYDATTTGTSHYAVVHVKGDDCRVTGIRLENVQNVGIYFDDVNRIQAYDNVINGNFPMASYTGTNTGHFGIAYNPGTTGGGVGAGIISRNIIDGCVQGVFTGNYGSRGTQAGIVITSNNFSNCHNHGIYHDDASNPAVIGLNSFTECQIPIITLGAGHSIAGNTLSTFGLNNNDEKVGIQARNAVDCAIVGNTIRGYLAGSIGINLNQVNAGTTISGNVIQGNTIEITDTGSPIQLGTGTTLVLTDNVVLGNVLRGQGLSTTGIVALTASASATATYGNKVNDNVVVVRGASNGIWATRIKHLTVQANTVRMEYNAAASTNMACVLLADGCANCKVSGNDYMNTPGFGTNINMRGTAESGTVSKNQVVQNTHDPATGTLGYIAFLPVAGSEAYMDESGTGIPNRQCCAGSRWSQTDAGTGLAFWVKQSDSTVSTGWTAK